MLYACLWKHFSSLHDTLSYQQCSKVCGLSANHTHTIPTYPPNPCRGNQVIFTPAARSLLLINAHPHIPLDLTGSCLARKKPTCTHLSPTTSPHSGQIISPAAWSSTNDALGWWGHWTMFVKREETPLEGDAASAIVSSFLDWQNLLFNC